MRLASSLLTVLLLAGCAASAPKPAAIVTPALKNAFAREGLSVLADGCFYYRPLGQDRFLQSDSAAIAKSLLGITVAALHAQGIQERTHTAPMYCGMLVNSIIHDAHHARDRDAKAQEGSPPYYAHRDMQKHPAAVEGYLRLLRSVYGVVIQDGSVDRLPGVVAVLDALTLNLASDAADRAARKKALQNAAENGVTPESAALLQKRLKARYVLLVSELSQKAGRGTDAAAITYVTLTLGYGCLFATAGSDLCNPDSDYRYTAAALVDLQERRIVWQGGGESLEAMLVKLLG